MRPTMSAHRRAARKIVPCLEASTSVARDTIPVSAGRHRPDTGRISHAINELQDGVRSPRRLPVAPLIGLKTATTRARRLA